MTRRVDGFLLSDDMAAVTEQDRTWLSKRDYEQATLAERGRIAEELDRAWAAGGPEVARIDSDWLNAAGHRIEVRTYWPTDDEQQRYVIWVHGGGWSGGSLDSYDRIMRVLANASRAPVIGVGYTKVPEAVFPTQTEQVRQVIAHCAVTFADRPHRHIAGYSAGANIVMSALTAFGSELGPGCFTSAFLACGAFNCDFETDSYIAYDGFRGGAAADLKAKIEAYASGAIAAQDRIVFPQDFSNPACRAFYLLWAEHDLLRDDSIRLTRALDAQATDVIGKEVSLATHVFLERSARVAVAHDALQDAAAFFRTGQDPVRLTLTDALQAVSCGQLSATAIQTACNRQIHRHNDKLGAFVSFQRNASPAADGPLGGIPVAIKDLFDLADHPTRAGSRALPSTPARQSATAVQRLLDAGACAIGKTHTVEFAFGGWGTNPTMGTPWNPWDLRTHRVPGGSSSGSAVAVASGMAYAALGTDTGGSVRTPASHCGIVGVKTSLGVISRRGVFPLCPTHDTVGVLTRSVRDAALVLDVIAGPDEADETTRDAPRIDFSANLSHGVDGLNLAILPDAEMAPARSDVRALFDQAVRHLRDAGARIARFAPPRDLMSYLAAGGRIMSAESYAGLQALVTPEECAVDPTIRERILAGRDISNDEYQDMLAARLAAQETFGAAFTFDALLTPTCADTAIPVAEVDETAIVTPFGRFVNYLDLAAVSVPMGVARDGLPAGLQIVVPRFQDGLALCIAAHVEARVGRFWPLGL